MQILQPQYVKDFKCTGTACTDSCCTHWRINVDPHTYKKYQLLPRSEVKDKIIKSISGKQSKILHLNEKKECQLLDEKGLCLIHKELGHEYLCEVCKVYPRKFIEVNGITEVSLTLSCPEVANSVLKNKEKMEFEFFEEDIRANKMTEYITTHNSKDVRVNSFAEIRGFAIYILQYRKYTINERLFILARALNELNKVQTIEGISNTIEQVKREMEDGVYENCLDQIPSRLELQFKLFADWVKAYSKKAKDIGKEAVYDKVNQLFKYIDIEKEESADELIARYQHVSEIYRNSIEKQYDYIFENYLVNALFANKFPVNQENPVVSLNYILGTYSLIRIQLIGVLNVEGNLTEEDVVQIIQVHTRTFEHSANMKTIIKNKLDALDATPLACAMLMIK